MLLVKRRRVLCAISVLLVASLLTCNVNNGKMGLLENTHSIHGLESNADATLSSVSITNYVEDPDLSTEPETTIEGSSGEFSSNYHQAVDEEDFNYMELTWDHTANTPLDFRVEQDENLPYCFDFIYLYQEFEWLSNEIPIEAEFQFNISTDLTGSFATEDSGQLMFKVYVWMIDSSGNWIQIMKTFPPYSDIYQERRANFNYFDIQDTWGGMIENSSGLQDDPDDIVQVAIGLAPTFQFESFSGGHPWEFYEGSVSVRIKSMELWVYMEEDPDPSQVLLPLYNSTWEYSVREVFPDVPDEFENTTERFNDIETDIDGSVYVLCDTSSSYEYYVEEGNHFASQFLLKYSSKLELIWAKDLGNRTHGHALTIHDGYVYTTGYVYTSDETESKDLIVTKWSPDGDVLWQTEWGGTYDEEGSAIAVSSDGSIFVWSVYYNRRFEPEFWKSSFLKFDSSGTLLWNKTCAIPLLPGIAELEMQSDGMYSWDSGNVEKRDNTCAAVWNISIRAMAVNFDKSGNIYIATQGQGSGEHADEWQVMISKWSSNGAQLWHTNYTIPLPDGNSWFFVCGSIDVAPDGSVIAILNGMRLIYDYHLLKLDSNGNLLWDKIIGDDRWPVYGGLTPELNIGDNGLAYVGFERYGDYGIEVAVSAFVVGPYNLGLEIPLTMIVVVISGATLAVAVVVIYFRKVR
ncbi:MAG: hypothetical protein RTU63_10240 [Candidatus Thorarchaeota archaeon]